jgi:hypothetical protein
MAGRGTWRLLPVPHRSPRHIRARRCNTSRTGYTRMPTHPHTRVGLHPFPAHSRFTIAKKTTVEEATGGTNFCQSTGSFGWCRGKNGTHPGMTSNQLDGCFRGEDNPSQTRLPAI